MQWSQKFHNRRKETNIFNSHFSVRSWSSMQIVSIPSQSRLLRESTYKSNGKNIKKEMQQFLSIHNTFESVNKHSITLLRMDASSSHTLYIVRGKREHIYVNFSQILFCLFVLLHNHRTIFILRA